MSAASALDTSDSGAGVVSRARFGSAICGEPVVMADELAQIWLWTADEFEERPALAVVVLLGFALAIAGALIVLGV